MRVDELDISDQIADALNSVGFVNLHPPQAEAIPIALEGRNLVAAIPTASGKSLIGYIPALKTVVERFRRVLYIVPLKALASEKKDDFERFSSLGLKVHLSTGDLDSEDRGLSDADIVVATSEKADSMIRHGSSWIDGVGLVIADEIHMIHDPGRGPTLEVALTKMMRRNRDLQIIALSATISNAQDLADWLHAALVKSDWRPIPLKEGVFQDGRITFMDRTEREVPAHKEPIWSLVKQAVEDGGQSLVFVNSRRSTEALAVKFSKDMGALAGRELSPAEEAALEGDSEATATGKKLASCVKCGMAFHNAGLTYKQRKYVEDGFRAGLIKCIIATPTLAAGINLPARRVIVRDTTRFDSNTGNTPIPVMEVKQMCGRAGRPGYDPYGEAVLIAKNDRDYDHLMEDYVEHETEKLTSKLFNDKVLRSHILGLIATGDADSEDSVVDFLRETFFGTTSQLFGIEGVVRKVVQFLMKEDMVGCDVRHDTVSMEPGRKNLTVLDATAPAGTPEHMEPVTEHKVEITIRCTGPVADTMKVYVHTPYGKSPAIESDVRLVVSEDLTEVTLEAYMFNFPERQPVKIIVGNGDEEVGMVLVSEEKSYEDLEITSFGKRVSDLYIDPESASILKKAVTRIKPDTEPLLILIAAAMTPDVLGMYPKKCDQERLNTIAEEYEEDLLVQPDEIDDYIYEFFTSDLKSAALVEDWIEEVNEDVMTDSMGIGPGDIRSKVDMMDWIIYAMKEIAYIFNPDATKVINPLTTRIRYGVREELIDLVSFRGVGRSRARILYDKGIRSKSDVISVPESELAAINKIGPALARSMKAQTGASRQEPEPKMSPSEEEMMLDAMAAEYGEAAVAVPVRNDKPKKKVEETGPKQASLFDF